MTRKIDVRILTPFGADSGMGNWRTAQRYAQMLRSAGIHAAIFEPNKFEEALEITIGKPLAIVLNIARSAGQIKTFRDHEIPAIGVLTGTDLYGVLAPENATTPAYQEAERALHSVCAVITLQSEAQKEVQSRWPALANKVFSILQTSQARPQHAPKITRNSKTVRFLIAGHIRREKDPLTAFLAFAKAFPDGWAKRPDGGRVPVRLIHAGGSRDPAIAKELTRIANAHGAILLEGPLTHAQTLRLMTHVHALIQPSVAEGGALVVPEALARRLPVIASDIAAHRGQLGHDYPGFFKTADVDSLSGVLTRYVADGAFFTQLHQRAVVLGHTLCAPAHERGELVKLVRECADAA